MTFYKANNNEFHCFVWSLFFFSPLLSEYARILFNIIRQGYLSCNVNMLNRRLRRNITHYAFTFTFSSNFLFKNMRQLLFSKYKRTKPSIKHSPFKYKSKKKEKKLKIFQEGWRRKGSGRMRNKVNIHLFIIAGIFIEGGKEWKRKGKIYLKRTFLSPSQ